MNNNKQHYTPDGMHPEDAIYKVKTFINELQKVQENYFNKLVSDLKITKESEDWLFDYIYNSDETVDDFSHYLDLFKRKYEDMLFNDKCEDFLPTDFAEFSPMLHMSSYEPDLETAFPSYFCDKQFDELTLDTITIEKTNNDKV
jgi:hypothetical protein